MSTRNQPQPRQLKMKIDPKDEGGIYSNIATVLSSETELIIDFGMILPASEFIRIGSRIVMNPRTAKQLLMALSHNLRNYESKFGEIKLPQPPTGGGTMGPEIAQ
ncbi:DUF3467 domain-containing protein [bacterium]|nr:DUF3467 domain-containing protein [candidate division CSSED10-310 bacterium]